MNECWSQSVYAFQFRLFFSFLGLKCFNCIVTHCPCLLPSLYACVFWMCAHANTSKICQCASQLCSRSIIHFPSLESVWMNWYVTLFSSLYLFAFIVSLFYNVCHRKAKHSHSQNLIRQQAPVQIAHKHEKWFFK